VRHNIFVPALVASSNLVQGMNITIFMHIQVTLLSQSFKLHKTARTLLWTEAADICLEGLKRTKKNRWCFSWDV